MVSESTSQVFVGAVGSYQFYLFPVVVLAIALLFASFLAREKPGVLQESLHSAPLLLLSTSNAHQKKRTQRQRKKARKWANTANSNALDDARLKDTSAVDVAAGDGSDIESSACHVTDQNQEHASDSEEDLEAASVSFRSLDAISIVVRPAEVEVRLASKNPDADDETHAKIVSRNTLPGPTFVALGADVADSSGDLRRCACDQGHGCVHHSIYSRNLLLLHHELCKKIARGAPGLELEPQHPARQDNMMIRTVFLTAAAV